MFGIQTADVVVFALLEHALLHHGAGRDDADNIALYQALGGLGVLGLLTDGDLVALGDQPGDIALAAVERHAAHRRTLLLSAISAGKCELQLTRCDFCVLVEHLIKIAQTIEQNAVLVLLFDLKILLHHR